MRKERFSEEQIIRHPGRRVVPPSTGSPTHVYTLYTLALEIRRHGGIYARKLKTLEDENRKLKSAALRMPTRLRCSGVPTPESCRMCGEPNGTRGQDDLAVGPGALDGTAALEFKR